MPTHADDPAQKSSLAGKLVIASGCWGLLVVVVMFLLTSGILDSLVGGPGPAVPPIDILVNESGGYLIVALIIMVIHALVLFVAHTSRLGLVLAMGAMLFLSFVTGFTIGLYLLPCVVLLLLAVVVSPNSARPLVS